jgi:hypothetical protein
MKKFSWLFPMTVLISLSILFAQDMERGTLNGYEDDNATGISSPAPEKPAAKKQAAPVKCAPKVRASDETGSAGSGEVGEDEHFIQSDDYFISEESFTTQPWIYVSLAKMVTQPSASTKREAEFMKIHDGNKVWTKNYFSTAIAKKTDIKLGVVVIAFNDNQQIDVYSAPESKESSRGGAWFIAKIIDVTDLYKGFITVAGNYKVSPKNLRVIVK